MKVTTQKTGLGNESSARLRRISQVSGVMKWMITIFLVLILLIAILLTFALIMPNQLGLAAETIDFDGIERSFGDLSAMQRWGLAFFYDCIIASLMATLWYLRSLFARFQAHEFFSSQTLSAMIWCGIWFLIFGFFDFLEEPVSSYLTTLDLAEGERMVNLAIEGGEIFFIGFGVFFITLGWVMREAASVYEENQQFI